MYYIGVISIAVWSKMCNVLRAIFFYNNEYISLRYIVKVVGVYILESKHLIFYVGSRMQMFESRQCYNRVNVITACSPLSALSKGKLAW